MAAMDVSQDYDSDNSSILGDSEGDCDISSSDSGNEVPSESSGDDDHDNSPRDRPWVRLVDPESDTAPVHNFHFDFQGQTGPLNALPQDAEPVEYFLLIMNDILDMFLVETNAYGDSIVNRNRPLPRRSRLAAWRHVDLAELRAFLGLVTNMGLTKKTIINEYWNTRNPSQATPYYPHTMARDRFLLILGMFNFPPVNSHNQSVALARVNNLVDHLVNKFIQYYQPDREVSVDESLVGFAGRWVGIQYMPNKHHHRFGVKLYALCESATGYTMKFSVYSPGGEGRPFHIVMDLMEPLMDHGYSLFTDNFYTSPDLAVELYSRKTLLTGTTRVNRRHLPKCVKERLQKGQVQAARKGPLLALGWEDKKHVVMVSTAYSTKMMEMTSARGRNHNVPEAVRHYRLHMGGVDMSDMRLYHFLDERKTIKWTKKVFFCLIGRALLNAFVIYDKNCDPERKVSRYQFQVSVVEGLIGGYTQPRLHRGRPATPASADRYVDFHGHLRRRLPRGTKRDCSNCSDRYGNTGRRRTTWECVRCGAALCVNGGNDCWHRWHTRANPSVGGGGRDDKLIINNVMTNK